MPDHVHMFVSAPPQTAPAEIARTVKSISAIKIFTAHPKLKGRKFWGSGLWPHQPTSARSDTYLSEDTVRRYIQTQKERG